MGICWLKFSVILLFISVVLLIVKYWLCGFLVNRWYLKWFLLVCWVLVSLLLGVGWLRCLGLVCLILML